MDKWLDLALEAAREAGVAILRYYPQTLTVQYKQDGSPLTLADQEAHRVIADRLVGSGLVVVSEEGEDLHLAAERYWLVDPLDGTKDFLAGNGEFTVNIALVDQSRPVLGVVFAPAINTFCWGAEGMGAWRIREGSAAALSAPPRSASLQMAVSRFHDHPDVDLFASKNGITERVAIGSALKYGVLAAGGGMCSRVWWVAPSGIQRLGRRCWKRRVARCWIGTQARLWRTASHGAGTPGCWLCAPPIAERSSN